MAVKIIHSAFGGASGGEKPSTPTRARSLAFADSLSPFAREVAFLGRLRHPNGAIATKRVLERKASELIYLIRFPVLAVYAVVLHPETWLISASQDHHNRPR